MRPSFQSAGFRATGLALIASLLPLLQALDVVVRWHAAHRLWQHVRHELLRRTFARFRR